MEVVGGTRFTHPVRSRRVKSNGHRVGRFSSRSQRHRARIQFLVQSNGLRPKHHVEADTVVRKARDVKKRCGQSKFRGDTKSSPGANKVLPLAREVFNPLGGVKTRGALQVQSRDVGSRLWLSPHFQLAVLR